MKTEKQLQGFAGEDMAADLLRQKGYRMLFKEPDQTLSQARSDHRRGSRRVFRRVLCRGFKR